MREAKSSSLNREVPDYTGSFVLSHKLAKEINRYWRVRGVEANARVIKDELSPAATPVFCIRSDLSWTVPQN